MELSDIQRLENKIQTQVGWILLFLEFTIILKVLNTITFYKINFTPVLVLPLSHWHWYLPTFSIW